MKLTILGSGTAVPSLRRASPSSLLTVNGLKLLIDCGPGTLRRLLEIGVEHSEIDYLFLTHFHPDHSLDIIHLLFVTRYLLGPKREKPLTIYGGPGLSTFKSGLEVPFGRWIRPDPALIEWIELTPGDSLIFDSFRVETTFTAHIDSSLAYRFQGHDKNKSILISGDTDYSEDIIRLAKNVDLLMLECSFPDNIKVEGHLTPSIAGKMAHLAQCKRLLLTHLYPPCEEVDIHSLVKKYYKGEVIIAEDLMEIEV